MLQYGKIKAKREFELIHKLTASSDLIYWKIGSLGRMAHIGLGIVPAVRF